MNAEERAQKNRDRVRAWRIANPERERARTANWATQNRDRMQANYRRWCALHPEDARALARQTASSRRARLRDQFIEDVDPRVVYEMHGGRCGICGEFIEGDFHVDHAVPLARGGMHGYVNTQPAHPKCNLVKGAN